MKTQLHTQFQALESQKSSAHRFTAQTAKGQVPRQKKARNSYKKQLGKMKELTHLI